MRRLGVVLATVVLFGGLGVSSASAQTDAASVARAVIAAENAHNVPAVLGYFAPGAVVNLPTGPLATRAEIEGWQRELAAGNFHAETTTPVAVTPAIVTFSGNVALDSFRSLGLASLDSTWELTIAQGQITTFNFTFTPAAFARLGAALAGAAPAPAATPTSGSGGSAAPATASAGRTLALTGADLDLAAGAAGAVAIGVLLVLAAADRRRRAVRVS